MKGTGVVSRCPSYPCNPIHGTLSPTSTLVLVSLVVPTDRPKQLSRILKSGDLPEHSGPPLDKSISSLADAIAHVSIPAYDLSEDPMSVATILGH
jgi:hypothetical protein